MTKKLPIGLDSFRDFEVLDSIYVDKTAYIHELMNSGGKTFFLSRPRRFGKSLLLSTIKAIFEGRKELFKGLFIEDRIDWAVHPVITLDMSGLDISSIANFRESLLAKLHDKAFGFGLEIDLKDPISFLSRLIFHLYNSTGNQVVILVDEYDKPILDVIENQELASEIRQFLQSFYVVLKSSSSMMRFLMLTGVSKVSQTSIFSGLNNLNDITLDPRFAGICGYTQQELEQAFSEYIEQLTISFDYSVEETLDQIKHWYDGYSWDGQIFVYNPFSVLLLFDKGRFNAHWFGTGTPAFLLKLFKAKNNVERILEGPLWVPESFLDGQALENMDTLSLLFQTGYLTIKSYDPKRSKYELQLPNEEVRKAVSELILMDASKQDKTSLSDLADHIKVGFSKGDTAKAIENLDILLANTTYPYSS